MKDFSKDKLWQALTDPGVSTLGASQRSYAMTISVLEYIPIVSTVEATALYLPFVGSTSSIGQKEILRYFLLAHFGGKYSARVDGKTVKFLVKKGMIASARGIQLIICGKRDWRLDPARLIIRVTKEFLEVKSIYKKIEPFLKSLMSFGAKMVISDLTEIEEAVFEDFLEEAHLSWPEVGKIKIKDLEEENIMPFTFKYLPKCHLSDLDFKVLHQTESRAVDFKLFTEASKNLEEYVYQNIIWCCNTYLKLDADDQEDDEELPF